MERRSILVPHDFTPVGDNALKYAIKLGQKIQANVDLLHVVKDEKERAKASAQFEKIIADLKDKPAEVTVNYHIKSGTIFTNHFYRYRIESR
jgi:nucleotide-binding universal stress UspA family protein